MSGPTRKHDDTKWNIFSMTGKTLGKDPKYPNSLNNWVISDEKSIQLLPSHYALPESIRKDHKMFYFLIDNDDLLGVKNVESRFPNFTWKECAACFHRIDDFTKILREYGGVQKKFYLRVISANVIGDERPGESRVFADEVAVMIVLMRERQRMPFEFPGEEHKKIFLRFNTTHFSTITLNELEDLFKEFDVDKSLVTLVDDPTHIIGWKSFEKTGVPFKILNAIAIPILRNDQATLHMFQHLVCGINWEGVPNETRFPVIEIVHSCSLGFKKDYVALEGVVKLILHVRKNYLQNTIKSKFDVMYHRESPNDLLSYDEYKEMTVAFGLPFYVFANMDLPALPIWMLRALLILGWLHSIVQNEVRSHISIENIAEATISALMPCIPMVHRKFIKEVQKEAISHMLKQLKSGKEQSNTLNVYTQQENQMASVVQKEEQKTDEKPVKSEKRKKRGKK